MKKSFTLIEILIATTIFAIVLSVFVIAIWSVSQPKSKTKAMNNLREQSQQAMDTIVASIMEANRTEGGSYVNFAITDDGGNPIPCTSNPCSGNRLTTSANLPAVPYSSVYVKKAFAVYKGTPTTAQTVCAPSLTENCHLDIIQAIDGVVKPHHSLTTSDINVLEIDFSGYFWSSSNTNFTLCPNGGRCIAPYMTITLHTQSAYTEAGGAPDLWLKTTVRPFNTNNTGGSGGSIDDKLVY